jgi:hypothetical protein
LFLSDIPNEKEKQKPNTKTDTATAGTASSRRRTTTGLAKDDHKWQPQPKNHQSWSWKQSLQLLLVPPPPPEDFFVLIGDLLSLTVYGITDHLTGQIISVHSIPTDQQQLIHDMVATTDVSQVHIPVWWDVTTPQAGSILQSTLQAHVVTQYSPLLEPIGQATTVLVASWLLAGWYHRAFLFQNTLDCSTDHVLTVTGKTWLTSCILLVLFIMGSQAFCGCDHWATTFRQGDVNYLVDSLTVLVVWRFMASTMLGNGGGSGGGGK